MSRVQTARRCSCRQRRWEPTPARRRHRLAWAVLARVFHVDVTVCPACGGTMKILAALTDPTSIRGYLEGVGSRRAPRRWRHRGRIRSPSSTKTPESLSTPCPVRVRSTGRWGKCARRGTLRGAAFSCATGDAVSTVRGPRSREMQPSSPRREGCGCQLAQNRLDQLPTMPLYRA